MRTIDRSPFSPHSVAHDRHITPVHGMPHAAHELIGGSYFPPISLLLSESANTANPRQSRRPPNRPAHNWRQKKA
jgi:hypothetical protein